MAESQDTSPPGIAASAPRFVVLSMDEAIPDAVQALVADPTTAVGLRFTAAATISQWVFYL